MTTEDILASVQDEGELCAGHQAALERCEATMAFVEQALLRSQEAADELRAWGEALRLFAQAAQFMQVVESN